MSGYTSDVSSQIGCFTDVASRQYENVCTRGIPTGVIPPDGRALRSFLEVASGTTVNNVTVYPQLELGSTATEYEPPDVTEVTLPELDAPLMSVGDYADELVIEGDGSARVERATVGYTLDGDSSEIFVLGATKEKTQVFSYISGLSRTTVGAIVSPDLPTGSDIDAPIITCNSSGTVYIALLKTVASTLEELRTYLASNPITFWIATDTETEILSSVTVPELPAPTFNAYYTGGYVPSDTSVGYERDVNIAYEQLEAKISALNVAQATS